MHEDTATNTLAVDQGNNKELMDVRPSRERDDSRARMLAAAGLVRLSEQGNNVDQYLVTPSMSRTEG